MWEDDRMQEVWEEEGLGEISRAELEAFDAVHEEHRFSDAYAAWKEQLLKGKVSVPGAMGKKRRRRAILPVAFAATIAATTAVWAGVQISRLVAHQTAPYAQEIVLENADSAAEGSVGEIPDVSVSWTYLPEEMYEVEPGYLDFDDKHLGGVELILYRMDLGDAAFHLEETHVLHEEPYEGEQANGVYLDLDLNFNKKLYLFHPELHYVAELWASDSVSKEALCAIGDGLQLTPVTEEGVLSQGEIPVYNWSEYLAWQEEEAAEAEEDLSPEERWQVSGELQRMVLDAKTVGETISKTQWFEDPDSKAQLDITVTDVQVYDDLQVIPEEDRREELLAMCDEEGTLLPDIISFIRSGDGVDTIDDVAGTETVNRKLVVVTAAYTNAGEADLENLLVYGKLVFFEGEGESVKRYLILNHSSYEADYAARETWLCSDPQSELAWHDFHYSANGNGDNYLESLAKGETKTLKLGFLVDEDQLPMMYLDLMDGGDGIEPGTAFVDVRQ